MWVVLVLLYICFEMEWLNVVELVGENGVVVGVVVVVFRFMLNVVLVVVSGVRLLMGIFKLVSMVVLILLVEFML